MNFVRISKAEGEKLYAQGDPSISRSTIGNTKSQELKYGQSNSAMGSGDPTGIMTSIQISEPMFQSQKKSTKHSFRCNGYNGSSFNWYCFCIQ